MLNTRDALELYATLSPYLSEVDEKTSMLSWIKDLAKRDTTGAYVSCLEMATGKEKEELVNEDPWKLIESFSEFLIENQILALKAFWEMLGYGY